MVSTHSIAIVRGLSSFLLALAVLICALGRADKQRKANVHPNGSIDFSLNRRSFWASPLLVACLVYATINRLMHFHRSPLNMMIGIVFGLLLVSIAFSFPDTITVTKDGLEQIAWLWKTKKVLWADVAEVNIGRKSRTVTITGTDGTKIIHTRQLPDRARLLMEISRHCRENLPPDFPGEAVGEN